MRLAHTAGNELGDLRAEIENEDFLVEHDVAIDGASKQLAVKKKKAAPNRDAAWLGAAYSAR
jgi:hypothetical protein